MVTKSSLPPQALATLLPLIATSKSQLRKFQIVEGAVRCYARWGDGTTFDQIAKEAKTSRPLLLHYFKTKEEILLLAAQYVRTRFQERAIAALQRGRTGMEMLEAYLRDCFEWVDDEPDNATFLLFFLSLARTHSKFRKLNDEFVLAGQKRIVALLERAYSEGDIKKTDFMSLAKFIQTLVTGTTIQIGTENLNAKEKLAFSDFVIHTMRSAVGQKK